MKITNLLTGLKSYFDKFTISYPEGFVPSGTQFPYITYSVSDEDNLNEGLIQVRIYTKSGSFKTLTNLGDSVEVDIEDNGRIQLKDGIIRLYKGSPFFQLLPDEDINIKSAYVNINFVKIQI